MTEAKNGNVTPEEGKGKKPKLNLNRVDMPRQEPEVRRRNFDEVALGYTYEMAMEETGRCIQCKKRNCQTGCPVNIDIRRVCNMMNNFAASGAACAIE